MFLVLNIYISYFSATTATIKVLIVSTETPEKIIGKNCCTCCTKLKSLVPQGFSMEQYCCTVAPFRRSLPRALHFAEVLFCILGVWEGNPRPNDYSPYTPPVGT